MKYCTVLFCYVLIPFTVICQPETAAGNGSDHIKSITSLIEQAKHAGDYGYFNDAEKLYQTILEQSKAVNYRPGIMAWYNGKIFILCQQREQNKAISYAEAYQKWTNERNDPLEQAYSGYQYATIYRMKMQFDSSFYYLEKTLQQLPKGNADLEAKVYGAMSYNYAKMEIPDNAINYAEKAFHLYRGLKDTVGIAKTHIFIAPAYNFMNDAAHWYAHCVEGLRLAKQLQNPVLIMHGYINLSIYYGRNKKEDSIYPCLQEAYAIAEKLNLAAEKNELKVNIADEYNALGEYKKTIALLNEVYADTALHPLPLQRLHLSQFVYYDALKGLGRMEEANEMLEKYLALDQLLYQDKSRQKALAVDEKLKRSEQERKLAEKQWQIKKQNLGLLALGLSLVAAALLILFLRKKQQAGRQQIAGLQKEKELEKIKAQLSGQLKERIRVSKEIHDDLGSSLTAMGLLTELLQRQPEFRDNPHIQKISVSTREMITRMNDIIWSVNTHNDTTDSLLAHIRKFAAEFLQQAGITFKYEEGAMNKDYPLNNTARRNIYLTVKEALHNIVKHSGAKEVTVNAYIENDELKITVADDGKGFSPDHITGNGQGLQNMKMRMEEIGGKWHIQSGNGTTVSLTCSLNATTNETALSVK